MMSDGCLPDGTLTGNFAADTGRDIEVDHVLGANMSVRRSALEQIGGIVDLFPGTCLREESDIMLRLGRAGHRIVYTPTALVEHVAAPYTRGVRFDVRYTYYSHRNHVVLLSHTFGMSDPILRRYYRTALRGVGGKVADGAKGARRRPAVRRASGFGRSAARRCTPRPPSAAWPPAPRPPPARVSPTGGRSGPDPCPDPTAPPQIRPTSHPTTRSTRCGRPTPELADRHYRGPRGAD